ncbi:MAG: hypothetical protein ACYC2H_01270 [Thermoplasmatota archaeon]
MAGTPMPVPRQQFFDNNGDPLVGGFLDVYLAGTTTRTDSYSDAALTTPNPNPVELDSAGRAAIFLDALSYKFVLKNALGVLIWSQDEVSGVPGFGSASDVTGTAGEDIAARDAVFLSDGSTGMGGAGTAGRWVRLDATTLDKSVKPLAVGMAPAAIASGAVGIVRIFGLVDGFSGLTPGATYYGAASAGAITASRPQFRRHVGAAISSTVLLVSTEPRLAANDTLAVPISLGGVPTVGRADTSYPAGATPVQLSPGCFIQRITQSKLPPGVYKLRGNLSATGGATATAALFNLTDNVEMASVDTTATTGASLISSAITINHADTTEKDYGVKIKTSNGANLAFGWGFELFKETL